jgi:hypothetical protein
VAAGVSAPGERRRRGGRNRDHAAQGRGRSPGEPPSPPPRRGRGGRNSRPDRGAEAPAPGRRAKDRRRRDGGSRSDPFGWDAVTDASAFGLEQQERAERPSGGRTPSGVHESDAWSGGSRRSMRRR